MGRMDLPRRRWPALLAPLAAAVAATAIMAGPLPAIAAAHTRGMTSRASLVHQVTAYVTAAVTRHHGTVTPIRTATNTTLPPIKVGQRRATSPSRSPRTARPSTWPTSFRTR
jgi:hypothetical protein